MLYGQFDSDGKPVGVLQRPQPFKPSGVPDGWHPHQLRDKPPEADPDTDTDKIPWRLDAIIPPAEE